MTPGRQYLLDRVCEREQMASGFFYLQAESDQRVAKLGVKRPSVAAPPSDRASSAQEAKVSDAANGTGGG